MLTASIIGTIAGGLSSVIPGIIAYLQRRDELKYQTQILSLKAKYANAENKMALDIINAKADASEGESLRSHDSSLDDKGFIGALRRSVRPVITYLFFFLFVFIKVVAVIAALKAMDIYEWSWADFAMLWSEILPVIWDDQTAAIFGAIMGFWFGSRAIEKLMRR